MVETTTCLNHLRSTSLPAVIALAGALMLGSTIVYYVGWARQSHGLSFDATENWILCALVQIGMTF
jgi:hypothetical protein